VGWTFFFMFVVLKVPVVAAFWLVWWAIRSEPAPTDDAPTDGGGGSRHRPKPRSPRPRRGPHAVAAPPAPRRVRIARGRPLTHR
jgi:hypothetical protein